MRILYGVCGEGMGHAIRSAVVGAHLRGLGHDITYVCSPGRAYHHLQRSRTGRVLPTLGLGTHMHENRVHAVATFLGNAAVQMTVGPAAHTLTGLLVGSSRPDVVLSDFEPFSARYAGTAGLPLTAIDNIHFATKCHQPASMRAGLGDAKAADVMLPVVHRMVPNASRYLVTSFVPAGVAGALDDRTSLHLPILRPETLRLPTSTGSHVVVYFNDKASSARLASLQGLGVPFHVYGTDTKTTVTRGNVTFLPTGAGFLPDLASSRAVIAGAGFTTMTEAIYLGKPMLAVPFEGQYEQILNANHLGLAGYGERASGLSREAVMGFLGRADGYREKLAGLKHDENRELLASVERAIGAH